MKSKVTFMVVFFVAFGFLFTASQAEEQKSELFMIEEQIAKPGKIVDLEASVKEMVAFAAQHNYQYGWRTYSDDNFRYYYLIPIKDLNDINNIMKTWAELAEKVGDPWQAVTKKYLKTYEYLKIGVIRMRPDLSYVPENPRLKPEEATYIRWGLAYVKTYKVEEFEEIMKKWVALFKEKNIDGGFNTYMGEMGTDNPFYFWAEFGKSPADFFTWNEKALEMLGEEVDPLWMKTLGVLRNYESKSGMFRPELSYIPEKK